QRDREIASVVQRGRWNRTDQQVAGDAAEIAGHERHHQHSEHVEPLPGRRTRAADGEHERADKVEDRDQGADLDHRAPPRPWRPPGPGTGTRVRSLVDREAATGGMWSAKSVFPAMEGCQIYHLARPQGLFA